MEEKKNEINNQENSESEKNNSVQNNSPTKSNNGLIGILIVIIVLLIAVVVYMLFFNKPKEELKDNSDNKETQETTDSGNTENTNEEVEESNRVGEEKGNYDLYVYVEKNGKFSHISGDYIEGGNKVGIKVQSANAKFIVGDENIGNYFLYDDNGIKLYDLKNRQSTNLDAIKGNSVYRINLSEDKKSVVGISYYDNNRMASYYNVKTKNVMYNKKYKVQEYYYISNISDDYLSVSTEDKSYLLSANSEKEILSFANDKDSYYKHSYGSYSENGKHIYTLEMCYDDGCTIKKIYNENLKLFFNGEINGESDLSVYNNALYVKKDNNKVEKHDMSGTLLVTRDYSKVMQIINNYVVYYDDTTLMLGNIDDKNETVTIAYDVKGVDYDVLTSGYYSRETLDIMGEKDKKEGIYVVYYYGYNSNGSSIKDDKGYYGIEYCYTSDKQIIEYPIKQEMGGRAKPVLYLYPTKETNVTVTFSHPEYLTTTYPKYNNEWNVIAKPNGDLKDSDGKYYYALYWDEKRYNEVDFKEGFYVEENNAIKFLEEKLEYIGLNDKERNEFIMYWLPIMENNKKNLVYFELTEERELGNKLIIEPKPDSLLRVSIHIKKVNEKVSIKEQKLKSFNRHGFTAVEWGGMTY